MRDIFYIICITLYIYNILLRNIYYNFGKIRRGKSDQPDMSQGVTQLELTHRGSRVEPVSGSDLQGGLGLQIPTRPDPLPFVAGVNHFISESDFSFIPLIFRPSLW